MQTVKPFFIKVITPLHAGSGSDLGVVDMPIQRESHTSFPKIEASSLKGSIRKAFEDKAKKIEEEDTRIQNMQKIQVAFGFDLSDKDKEYEQIVKIFRKKKKDNTENGEIEKDFSGSLGFSDAKILFFPVKSVKGVFAYITCPMVLKRLKEEQELLTKKIQDTFDIPDIDVKDDKCIVLGNKVKDNEYENKTLVINNNSVILEEYSFTIKKTETKEYIKIPNLNIDKERIVIISDDNFTHFVKNSTEVITRTKIDNLTGTVAQGALFTEEYLPAETIMYSLAIANKPFSSVLDNFNSVTDVMDFFNTIPTHLQIGGNSTLGKGIVEISCEGCKDECK